MSLLPVERENNVRIETRFFVPGTTGLHLRLAARLVRALLGCAAEVAVECGGRSANARSILDILSLGAGQGARVTVTAEGCDAHAAIHAIEALFSGSAAEMENPFAPRLRGPETQTP